MTYLTHCPITVAGGKDCWQEPHPGNSFGLCATHWRKIVDQWMQDQPTVTARCVTCDRIQVLERVEITFAICQYCHHPLGDPEIIEQALASDAERDSARASLDRPGVVYYMRFGDRVKIGFTTDLRIRSKQVPNDEVVAAEPGNIFLERQRHTEFAPELVPGHVEWFTMTPRLAFHMANVRDRHGDPLQVKASV